MTPKPTGTITMRTWRWSVSRSEWIQQSDHTEQCRKTAKRFTVIRGGSVDYFSLDGTPIGRQSPTGWYRHEVLPETYKDATREEENVR